ncbi:uncharacterized protein RCC_02334 [Ramularia collo-cygni]|uniref:Uncharacterized protein n=1 Tax=Ramularia collo-cygni TaxID=112498 RepID=A0A2D3UNK4_9PEZI|nr:uncharacterized protein RCC_02334 [Ramularia collo-cygni]CZT16491.1 uncharacterized protein RCC_02334 [Ramularia collo-cygni]
MADKTTTPQNGASTNGDNSTIQPPVVPAAGTSETQFWQAFNDLVDQIIAQRTRDGSTGPISVTREAIKPLFKLLEEWKPALISNTQWVILMKEEKLRSDTSKRSVQDAVRDAMSQLIRESSL